MCVVFWSWFCFKWFGETLEYHLDWYQPPTDLGPDWWYQTSKSQHVQDLLNFNEIERAIKFADGLPRNLDAVSSTCEEPYFLNLCLWNWTSEILANYRRWGPNSNRRLSNNKCVNLCIVLNGKKTDALCLMLDAWCLTLDAWTPAKHTHERGRRHRGMEAFGRQLFVKSGKCSGIKHQASNTEHQNSSTTHQASRIKQRASSVVHRALNIEHKSSSNIDEVIHY